MVYLLDGLLHVPRLNRLLHLHPVRHGRQVNVGYKQTNRIASIRLPSAPNP
jgi:hypothetical protein